MKTITPNRTAAPKWLGFSVIRKLTRNATNIQQKNQVIVPKAMLFLSSDGNVLSSNSSINSKPPQKKAAIDQAAALDPDVKIIAYALQRAKIKKINIPKRIKKRSAVPLFLDVSKCVDLLLFIAIVPMTHCIVLSFCQQKLWFSYG